MAEVTLFILGAPRARVHEREHVLNGSQPRLLLARLAIEHGHPLTAEQLAAVLWPHSPGQHWEGALRGVLSKVRHFLGPLGGTIRLENVGRSYRLSVDEHAGVDLWQAEREVAHLESRPVETSDRAIIESARRTVKMLDAPLLPGHDAAWLDAARADLGALRHRAMRTASRIVGTRGRHDEAIGLAMTVIANDPFDEDAHRLVMLANEAAGRRGAALRAYETCRRVLADELGSPPSPETEALYLQLLTADVGADRTNSARPLATDPTRRFVGRTSELDRLTSAWSMAAAGAAQLVFVTGEAGIGKTRLALEAIRLSQPSHVLYGRCSAEQIIPYEPFSEAIASHVSQLDHDELLALVGPFATELAAVIPAIAVRLGVEGSFVHEGDNRPRLFEAVRSIICQLSRAPIAMVIDDLHAADRSTLLLFRHLVRALPPTRILVLATYRDDLELTAEVASAIEEAHRHRGCQTVRLGCLDPADIAELLVGTRLPHVSKIAAALHDRTGGNAFYVSQVLRTIDERGADYQLADVPDTVVEVVRSRLAQLAQGPRSVLELAAVIGTSISREVFDGALGRIDGANNHLDQLLVRHLLVESASGELSFAHTIVRDAAYGLLPSTRRRRLHLDVAHSLRSLGAGRFDLAPALASHLELADDRSHAEELVDACLRSADFAMASFDYDLAESYARRARTAADRLPPEPGRDGAIRLGLGAALRRLGRFPDACVELLAALDVARQGDLGVLFAEALLELISNGGRGVAPTMSDLARITLFEEAIERLADEDIGLAISLQSELALAFVVMKVPERMLMAAQHAADLAAGVDRLDIAARGIVSTRLLLTRPDRAGDRLADTDRFIDASPSVLTAEQRVRLHMWRLADRIELGDRQEADRELAALRLGADQLGQPYWLWVADSWQACHRFITGDIAEAELIAANALSRLKGIDHPEASMSTALQVAVFKMHQGQGAELTSLFRLAVEQYPSLPSIRSGYALSLAQAGELDASRGEYRDLLQDRCAAVPIDGMWSITLASLTEVACLLGDADGAAQLIPVIRAFHDRFVVASVFGAGVCWGPFSAQLAGLHATIGDRHGAKRWYDEALAAAERFGSPTIVDRILRMRVSSLAGTDTKHH